MDRVANATKGFGWEEAMSKKCFFYDLSDGRRLDRRKVDGFHYKAMEFAP